MDLTKFQANSQNLIEKPPDRTNRGEERYRIAEFGAELLDDEGEASRDLLKHRVGESPVRLCRDLLAQLRRRDLQLHQSVQLLWMFQHRPHHPHFSLSLSGYSHSLSVSPSLSGYSHSLSLSLFAPVGLAFITFLVFVLSKFQSSGIQRGSCGAQQHEEDFERLFIILWQIPFVFLPLFFSRFLIFFTNKKINYYCEN